MTFRLVEDVLGKDALERPPYAEWMAMWDRVKVQPIPDYPELRRRRVHERRA